MNPIQVIRFKLPVLFMAVFFLILTSSITAHAVPAGTVKVLMDAAYDGEAARVQTMLDEGIDANLTNKSGMTALLMASWSGNEGVVKILLNT